MSVTGDTARFERLDAPGQWFSLRGFLRQDAQSGTAERRTVFRNIAPDAGHVLTSAQPLTFQREYLSNGELVVHATSWTVEGRERITVPAGTFDCWVIVWRSRSLQTNWTGFERWWYSPEAQHYVRMEYKYGATPTASRVLMRYSLPRPPIAEAPAPVAAPVVAAALPLAIPSAPVFVAPPQPDAAPVMAPAPPAAALPAPATPEAPAAAPEPAAPLEVASTAPGAAPVAETPSPLIVALPPDISIPAPGSAPPPPNPRPR